MTNAAISDAHRVAVAQSGWGYPVRLFQPHNPAFWLYSWLIISGAHTFLGIVGENSAFSPANGVAILLEFLYALPFFWWITRADRYEREPAKLAVMGFLWGGLVATWVLAAPANNAVLSIYAKLFGIHFASTWGPPLTAPFTEELAKFLGLIMLVLLGRNHFRSPYDGLILGAFVGLGFQVFENYSYIINQVSNNFGSQPVQDIVTVFVMRTATGFWSHALYTAMTGAGLGYFLSATDKPMARRLGVAALFYVGAMAIHGSLDAAGALGVLAIPIVIITGTVGGIIAWRFADRRQRRWMAVLLQDEVADGTVTNAELTVLAGQRRDRSRYLAAVRKAEGNAAARRAENLLDAQIELAAVLAGTNDPQSLDVRESRQAVRDLRGLPSLPEVTP